MVLGGVHARNVQVSTNHRMPEMVPMSAASFSQGSLQRPSAPCFDVSEASPAPNFGGDLVPATVFVISQLETPRFQGLSACLITSVVAVWCTTSEDLAL